MRGFHAAQWNAEGNLLAQFGPYDKSPEQVGLFRPGAKGSEILPYKVPEAVELEGGRLLGWKKVKDTWDLTAYSPVDAGAQWTRHFASSRLGATTNDGNDDLLLSSQVTSALGKERLKGDAGLQQQRSEMKEKSAGRVIEVVNPTDGTTRRQVVVEVPKSYAGVDGFNQVGDVLYLSTGDNRTIVYSMVTGKQLRQVFGSVIAVDQASGAGERD